MINTQFQKVQTMPSADWGVVTVLDEDMECPETGCDPILFDN